MNTKNPSSQPPAKANAFQQALTRDGGEIKPNQELKLPGHETPSEPADSRDEEVFRASELRYRRLFEAARDGILILEVDTGQISDVNPFLIELLGYSHEELVGMPIWELGPFRDIVSNKAKFERLQEQRYVRYDNLPLEAKDGRKIAVEFVSNVYRAGDRNVIQCNVRDITERTEAEKQRLRVAAVIEYSEDAIVTKTIGGIVIGWNSGAERMYGYTAEEMIGRSVSILFPLDHYREYLRIMEKVAKGETVGSLDTVRLRKDGTPVNVSVNITPIEAHDGKVVGASKSSHDIGRIKKLEAQLIEAQKMEVIGHLAGGVAHDFNNIIGVIMIYSELLASALEPESVLRTYSQEIQYAAELALGITRQLLVFSRKETVQPVILDLNDVIQNLDKMLRRLIDEKIEMTIAPGEQIGHVKADPGYIGQVLMNLVVNARDAMPHGGTLSIATSNAILDEDYARTHRGAIPGDYVMLCVSDTGIGMTDEVKAHLFEAFFTTKPKGKGTGLGLATCQTIVQQFGGHIGVCSQIGKGTTFRIYFPVVEQTLDIAAPPILTEPLPRGTETLLVVEDEPSLRHVAASVLEAQGYTVLRATNGKDGLRVASAHNGSPICLVVTDVIMPQMGGKVMAERLKIAYPDIKILFTSGYTDDSISEHGALDAEVGFLSKPFTGGTLIRKVQEMLGKNTECAIG